MNTAYLKIENPGVAPSAAFTLLGASTKRDSDNQQTIGKFGTGNKQGVALCLRNNLKPIVYAGNLRMEFDTRPEQMDSHTFNRVVVRYGGKDEKGVSRTAIEDLGFVVEHGAIDWQNISLALREFISNALDRAVEEGEANFIRQEAANSSENFLEEVLKKDTWQYYTMREKLQEYRKTSKDYQNVTVEIVNEKQVRARAGYTRVFIPLNDEVLKFYQNLGKWFLHFSEPESIGVEVLPKTNRSIDTEGGAVIYRRGVRVREINNVSLFDYNLEDLKLDESRQTDQWLVMHEASKALSMAEAGKLAILFQSFTMDCENYWEHKFDSYGLQHGSILNRNTENWKKAFEMIGGDQAMIATEEGGKLAGRKGYKIINAPDSYVKTATAYGLPTPATVLSADEKNGREVCETTQSAIEAVDFAWSFIEKHKLSNGRQKPEVKCYRQIINFGAQSLGFYSNNTVYLNLDICDADGLNQQLLQTAMEEIAHHVSGACDYTRDFQDFLLNLLVHIARDTACVQS